jgi:PAS domain-containing protein
VLAIGAAVAIQVVRLAAGFPDEEPTWLARNLGLVVLPFLAAYFARRRVRARARRSFDGAAALVVALDADGRVEIANGTACAAFGFAEDDLVGRDWFAVAVPEPERASARAAYASLLAGEQVDLADTPGIAWRWSLARDADGGAVGALGWGEPEPR